MFFEVILFLVVLFICWKAYVKITTGKCTCQVKMYGKTVIITGSNTGIGKETALDLARRGARVILACRDLNKAEQAKNDIISKTGNNNVVVRHLDLSSFESIRKFAQTIYETEERLDVLINNAGTAYLSDKLTEYGLNPTMQVNHFGPFLLTNLLLDLLKRSAPSRIVNVASLGYLYANLDLNNLKEQNGVYPMFVYFNSKLCNILMSNELAQRLEGTGVTSNSLHPGVVYTGIVKNTPIPQRWIISFVYKTFYKNVKEGAQTTIHLAVADELEKVNGAYFADCEQRRLFGAARNKKLQQKLWELSEEVVQLKETEKLYNKNS